MKLKAVKFCIINQHLYWNYLEGVLLNCHLETEAQQIAKEFHARMWDLKREVSLNPFLLTMLYFIIFTHEMNKDMLCIHRILRIIHL